MAITEQGLQLVAAVVSRDEFFAEVRELALQAKDGQPLENTRSVKVRDGVAIIPLRGPMVRHASMFSAVSGATSYATLLKDFQQAMASAEVRSILFEVDSPGGEVHGCGELARSIFEARGQKPITAYVTGQCCSAAYWIASACDRIVADRSAVIGSIGVRAMLVDDSKALEAKGIKEHVILSSQSPLKAIDPAKDSDRARVQELLTAQAAVFIADVARHRGVTEAQVSKSYGRGDVFIASDALDAGLIDSLGAFESLLSDQSQGASMSGTKTNPQASIADGSCDGCGKSMGDDDECYCGACSNGASAQLGKQVMEALAVDSAAKAIGAIEGLKAQAAKVEALEKQLTEFKAEQEKTKITALIEGALKDGRISHADRAKAEGVAAKYGAEGLEAMLSISKPATAPHEQPAANNDKAIDASGLTEEEKTIAKATGLTLQEFAEQKALINNQRIAPEGLED